MNKRTYNALLIEAALGSIVLCTIAFLIQSSFGFNWADEGLLWYGSQRAYVGELPIRDFFAYDPGRYYWNSAFFFFLHDTGLNTLLIAAATFGALGLAASWYTMGVAKVEFVWRVLFAVLITIAMGYPRHKVYEQSLSLILVAIVFFVLNSPSSLRNWYFFGLITGIAAIFGRNHGVFFVVSAILCGFYIVATQKLSTLPRAGWNYSLGVISGYLPIIILLVFDVGFRENFGNLCCLHPNGKFHCRFLSFGE